MLVADAERIIDEYARWVRESMVPVQQGNAVRIVTPMLDRNNDCLSVLVGESPDGGYVITDLGETVADLELSGVRLSTDKRSEMLDRFVRGYGVSRSDQNELYVRCSSSELVQKMNMLIQAMASVDDMFMLAHDSVRELFMRDVGGWLLEHDVRYVDGPSFPGRSGLMYKFDYAIGRSRRKPERLIKTVNRPTDANVKNALFGWQDIGELRKDSIGYVFLNAANCKDSMVPQSAIGACRAYGLIAVQWGIDEEEHLPDLAA